MRAEHNFEDKVVEHAEAWGYFVRKVQWGTGRRGAPDRVFIRDGQTIWIELKAPSGPTARLQTKEHDRMRAAGANVHVADNMRDVCRILGIPRPKA